MLESRINSHQISFLSKIFYFFLILENFHAKIFLASKVPFGYYLEDGLVAKVPP